MLKTNWMPILVLATAVLVQSGVAAAQADFGQIRRLAAEGQVGAALESLDLLLAGPVESAAVRAEARFLRGLLLVQAGDVRAAGQAFAELVEQYPAFPEPYNNLAVLEASEGNYETARKLLLAALEQQPGYAVALENLGDLYVKMAADAYQRARALEPDLPAVPDKLRMVQRMFPDEGG